MARIAPAWRLAALGIAALVPACAPRACATIAPPAPAPPPTVALHHAGDLTIVYDGAGSGAAHIGLIGDSTMASIRWAGAYAPLRRWDYVYDAESCRRTLLPSCAQPDGWAPETGITVMRRLSGQLGQVLVVMLGPNDAPSRFGEGVDDVVAEAEAQGISAVIWLTIPTMASQNATLAQRVEQDGGFLRLADWAGYVVGHPEWLNSDGLHVSTAGAPVLSQFIADQVAAALAG